jgi:DnaJ-domain-containing protein 1
VETEYWKKLKKMTQKKEEALQLILKIKDASNID